MQKLKKENNSRSTITNTTRLKRATQTAHFNNNNINNNVSTRNASTAVAAVVAQEDKTVATVTTRTSTTIRIQPTAQATNHTTDSRESTRTRRPTIRRVRIPIIGPSIRNRPPDLGNRKTALPISTIRRVLIDSLIIIITAMPNLNIYLVNFFCFISIITILFFFLAFFFYYFIQIRLLTLLDMNFII